MNKGVIRIGGNFEFYTGFCAICKITIFSNLDIALKSGVITFRIIKIK